MEGVEATEIEVETERFAEYKDLADLGELGDECVRAGGLLGELSMIEAGKHCQGCWRRDVTFTTPSQTIYYPLLNLLVGQ